MATLNKKKTRDDKERKSGQLLSLKTIQDTVKILRMIFADAEEEMELIPSNPVRKPKYPKRKTSKKRERGTTVHRDIYQMVVI